MTLLTLHRREPQVAKGAYENEYTDFLNSFVRAKNRYMNDCENSPAVNIAEESNRFVLHVAAPGYKKDNFNINVEKDILIISATVPEEDQKESEKYSRCEFTITPFERRFTMGKSIDSSKIEATYKDGILAVFLGKKEEALEKPARSIKVE